ncbi:TetR/AcrR family transcriptional regulator C-terminal domain-containing protein [Sphingomicrobium flavum]|uniref:TetR/AcrR family transcriptional regulator C-terminal domain-containing protein n=1 Tax=Sphingomicrobium flavum TaxID=1229164 RepID=UPI0021ADE0D0|nr:TetR/AcrR family transcriptional regulator C-terminal domain-containing protein [Sphingomicrobium flavum]
MTEKSIRPSSEAKRQAIIEAAAEAFFEQGYEAASIEAIAADAGVSKVTVYSYFGGKSALFSAAVERECRKMSSAMQLEPGGEHRPLRQRLEALGQAFNQFMSRPELMRFDRRIAAEAERDPTIGDTFMNAGPRPMCLHMAAMIEEAHEAGEVDVPDFMLAAEQFVSMVKGFGEMERRFCGKMDPDRDQDRIAGAVEVFMRAYEVKA